MVCSWFGDFDELGKNFNCICSGMVYDHWIFLGYWLTASFVSGLGRFVMCKHFVLSDACFAIVVSAITSPRNT